MKLDQNTASEIVRNVLGAANQKAQVLIEADLHAVSVKEVKGLLKDAGIDLRSLKGARKHAARHGVEVKSGRRRKPYKKPEIIPEPPTEEQAAKVYEEFGVPGFIKPNLTESEQKAIDDLKEARTISSTIEETAAEKQRVDSVALTEKADGSIDMAMKLVDPAEKRRSGDRAQAVLESLTVLKVDGRDFENEFRRQMDKAIEDNPGTLEPLGQPCTDPSTMLLYGEAPQKIASLEEVFDGLRAKAEKLRDQRRELAEQLRKTDDLLAYISMRCDIITEIAGEAEKKDPADCLTYIGET